VGFEDKRFDERPHARRVAAHFGTRHVEVVASQTRLASTLFEVIQRIAEPVADPAILPTCLLAGEARAHTGVVLSGEGADELFGGYPTYQGHRLAPWFTSLPRPIRSLIRSGIEAVPSSSGRIPLEFLLKRFAREAGRPWFDRHVAWFGTGLPGDILDEPLGPAAVAPCGDPGDTVLGRAMRFDYAHGLRNGLLVKNDRATMLASLEARAPYLDREVTRFALALPDDLRVRPLSGKWLLRQVARRWLPARLRRRSKRGLSVPVGHLLNGPLAVTLDRALEPGRLAREGLLKPRAAGELVSDLRRGNFAGARGVWTLLIWQLWLDHWIPGGRG
jgi:asparagine synthase (glutamine-hydrolysing)